jgi:hypothetical protein
VPVHARAARARARRARVPPRAIREGTHR